MLATSGRNPVVERRLTADYCEMSRSRRFEPWHRQAQRRAPSLDRWRVRVHRPRQGFVHPAGRRDILQVFKALGPWVWHGPQVVELRQKGTPDPVDAKNALQAWLCERGIDAMPVDDVLVIAPAGVTPTAPGAAASMST